MTDFNLEEVVGLFTKQPAEFLETLKNEDGEFKQKDVILAAIKKANDDRTDNAVKGENGKAVRLRMKQLQNYIRENYQIESNSDVAEDHIKALVEKLGQPGKEKIVKELIDLDEHSALAHPMFKKLMPLEVAKATAELQRSIAEKDKQFRDYVESDNINKLDTALFKLTSRALQSEKAALDKDAARQEKQLKMFVAGLKSQYKFKLDADGNPYPIDKDGEPLMENYAELTLADIVKRENIFGVHNFDPDKGSPGATSQTANLPRFSGTVPKTNQEFNDALKAEPDAAKRKVLHAIFKDSQEKGK